MIDFNLTEEQQILVENVRKFAQQKLAPHIEDRDYRADPDPGTFKELASIGLPGICFPEKYGGSAMDYVSLGLACEELEYVDTSIRTIMSIHVGLCGCGIYQWGSEEQRKRFLVPLAKGDKFGAFGLTEPDAGSDVAGMKATAKKDGNSYILNGNKLWISGANFADTFLVFAYTNREMHHRGISAFIVERTTPGFSTFPIPKKAGVKAGDVGGINLQDVRVPKENLLGEEGEGFKIAMSCLDNGRYTVAAGATGLIRACLDASVKFAHERKAFGQPIGKFQLIQQMIAQMVSKYDASRLLYMKAGWMKNRGIRCTRETSLAKWFGTVSAWESASDAVEIFGAYGYSDEYPVFRFLRNSKGAVIYEGTRQIHTLMQAEYALGYREDRPLRCPLPACEEYVKP